MFTHCRYLTFFTWKVAHQFLSGFLLKKSEKQPLKFNFYPFHRKFLLFSLRKTYVSGCNRPSFALQKLSFYHPKAKLSRVKDIPFRDEEWEMRNEKWLNKLTDSVLTKVAHFCVIWREKNFFFKKTHVWATLKIKM